MLKNFRTFGRDRQRFACMKLCERVLKIPDREKQVKFMDILVDTYDYDQASAMICFAELYEQGMKSGMDELQNYLGSE